MDKEVALNMIAENTTDDINIYGHDLLFRDRYSANYLPDVVVYAKEILKNFPSLFPIPQRTEQSLMKAPHSQTKNVRRNYLYMAIEKAITKAGSTTPAEVFLNLKELALSGEPPFTGVVDGNALYYTDQNDKLTKITMDALRKRLGRRVAR